MQWSWAATSAPLSGSGLTVSSSRTKAAKNNAVHPYLPLAVMSAHFCRDFFITSEGNVMKYRPSKPVLGYIVDIAVLHHIDMPIFRRAVSPSGGTGFLLQWIPS